MKNVAFAIVAVAAALTVGAVVPVYSEAPPSAPATAVGKIALERASVFQGQGFFSDQAVQAASLRGRASLRDRASSDSRASTVSFASPEAAVAAFIAALEKNDVAALDALLGPGNADLLSTGNGMVDAILREKFVLAYRARHVLLAQGADTRLLAVGENAWPLPIPVVAVDGKWHLDGSAGAEETLVRRIGQNELGVIAVCRTFVVAQTKYAAEGRDGNPPGIFAARLLSDKGKHNGLFWPNPGGKPPSPGATPVTSVPYVGVLPKKLLYDLTPQPGGKQKPIHGYYYRMLFAQGAHATGGARDYVVDGSLTGGVALLARPADYGDSGVMSFIVNQAGVVYEKDLGADTAAVADAIQSFDPDSAWSIVQ